MTVRVMFGHTILENGKPVECAINVAGDGSDSVLDVKKSIAVRLLQQVHLCNGCTACWYPARSASWMLPTL